MNRQTIPMFRVLVTLTTFAAAIGSAFGQTVLYVDASATGAGDGSSWVDAYPSVQAALNAAQSGQQVWVASGTYVENITLARGVALYGGFAGNEDPGTFDPADRDFVANETILDGNQSGSVVAMAGPGYATTHLDGFTITGGSAVDGAGVYAQGSYPRFARIVNCFITGNTATGLGGGMYLCGSGATIANNTITSNGAPSGAGIYLCYSSPTVTDNTITCNNATDGGGVYLDQSTPTFRDNTVADNSALLGGGIYLYKCSPTISHNTITGNYAYYGGGLSLYLYDSHPVVAYNLFADNRADNYGGALFAMFEGGSGLPPPSALKILSNTIRKNIASYGGGLWVTPPRDGVTIAGNTIVGNRASEAGGGAVCGQCQVANNVIAGNRASWGGGLYAEWGPTIVNNVIVGNNGDTYGGGGIWGSATIANTIIAFNSSGLRYDGFDIPTLRHNCVFGNDEYDYAGTDDPTGTNGNVAADPLFLLSPEPGPDGTWGTEDDVVGDLHLRGRSPCVDAGTNGYVYGDQDLDGRPRVVDGDGDGIAVVDMGAYELLPGDLDGDGDVDVEDYGAFAVCVTGPTVYGGADCDGDHDVDLEDFVQWVACLAGPGGEAIGACEPMSLDGDGDVDLADFALVQARFSGPSGIVPDGCEAADIDDDKDIDLGDFARFAAAFNGGGP